MRNLILALLLLALLHAPRAQQVPVAFPPHPRVAHTAPELAALKADPARQHEVRALLARAEGLLAKGLTVPQQEGQWVFYYACPKDAARLRPESLEKHVCPTCGAVYTDARTQAAYRTVLHDQLNDDCLTLATAYGLTGEVKYALPVKHALLELARLFPTWPRHDRWGRTGLLAVGGGKRYAQHLDEAYSIIRLARAYDLIANAVPEQERAVIEQDFLAATVREILRLQAFVGYKNNHQTWFNAAYATVGLAIGDEALMREGVYGDHGLLWQLNASVTDDGLWYEGALAYQRYAMQAIIETLEPANRIGWNFADHARLKSLWTGPINLAYPNGQLPVINDSDPANLDSWKDIFRWGYAYFKDPVLAAYAGLPGEKATLKSVNLPGMGIAILRGGTPENPIAVMMDYGQHGDHHGHPDKLNIVVYALGQEWLLDPGRLSYSVPEYESWARTTVAHNTVVINGKNQQPDTGKLLLFNSTPGQTAAFAISNGAYPGFTLKRYLILAGDVLIDVFAVDGKQQAQIDWVMHGRGAITTPVEIRERTTPLGDTAGDQHLTALREGSGEGWVACTFTPANGKPYRAYCLTNRHTTLVTGNGIGYSLTDTVPFLMRRVQDHSATFLTVYDLSGFNRNLAIEHAPVREAGRQQAQRIRITITPDNAPPSIVHIELDEATASVIPPTAMPAACTP